MTRLVGLYREAECSPGRHRSNDTLLLEQIAVALEGDGFSVDLVTLDTRLPQRPTADLIFSMCQAPAALEILTRWEDAGAAIVNSPRAARHTYRDRLPAILERARLPFPATRLVGTRGARPANVTFAPGVWLKRGDVHASVIADVQWIDSHAALEAGLQDFAARGISHAVLQAHCAGDEIKFYGVSGGFFSWFHSGATRSRPVDARALERLAVAAAEAVGLDVFGGDLIVGDAGELTLIDLNDWPSFAPCRDAASRAIAATLKRRVHALWHDRVPTRSNENESAV